MDSLTSSFSGMTIKNVENELSSMFDDLDLNKVNKMIKKVEFATKRNDLDNLIKEFGKTHIRVRKLKQSKRKAQNDVEDLISSMNTLKVVPSAKQKRKALLKALRQKKMKLYNKFVDKSISKPKVSKSDLFGQMKSVKDQELDDLMMDELGMGDYDTFGIESMHLGGKKRKRKRRIVKSKKKGGAKKKSIKKKKLMKKKKSIKKKKSMKKKIGGKKRKRISRK